MILAFLVRHQTEQNLLFSESLSVGILYNNIISAPGPTLDIYK